MSFSSRIYWKNNTNTPWKRSLEERERKTRKSHVQCRPFDWAHNFLAWSDNKPSLADFSASKKGHQTSLEITVREIVSWKLWNDVRAHFRELCRVSEAQVRGGDLGPGPEAGQHRLAHVFRSSCMKKKSFMQKFILFNSISKVEFSYGKPWSTDVEDKDFAFLWGWVCIL